MEPNRKFWNEGQQKLRLDLAAGKHTKAIEQFLVQHAMTHSRKMSRMDVWSFEDELWSGLTEAAFRALPPKGEHSIAWILFHISRIEDITMNMLVAGTSQLYRKEKWVDKLKATIPHSANSMDNEAVAKLSQQLSMTAMREYRIVVGRRTREIVRKIKPEQFGQMIDAARLQKVLAEDAVIPEAMPIIRYWGKRTVAGLLLMPPTRHNFLHLNEAMRIKSKLQK